jgi:hypothetical protein
MLTGIIPLSDLADELNSQTETEGSPIVVSSYRSESRVVAPGSVDVDSRREIYVRARAIFKRASKTRAVRAAAIL